MDRSLYKRLGDYILPTMEKNVGLKVRLSQGINNNKYFQNPRQVALDSENDQIVRRGQFAFNKATTRNGEKISIAYRDGVDCTVSSAYQVFYIKDEEKLNPYYLMMWFKRPEFDRYARFKSHGSAHEFFTFEEMCNVFLPVPSIEEQRRIVSEYHTVERRIKNNEVTIKKLEETAHAIYHHTFVEGIDENNMPLSSYCANITDGVHNTVEDSDNGNCLLLSSKNIVNNSLFISDNERRIDKDTFDKLRKRTKLEKGDVLLTSVGTIGKLLVLQDEPANYEFQRSVAILKPKKEEYSFFIYESLVYENRKLVETAHGAVQSCLFIDDIKNFLVRSSDDKTISHFYKQVSPVFEQIKLLFRENSHLRSLLSLLTSKLS